MPLPLCRCCGGSRTQGVALGWNKVAPLGLTCGGAITQGVAMGWNWAAPLGLKGRSIGVNGALPVVGKRL